MKKEKELIKKIKKKVEIILDKYVEFIDSITWSYLWRICLCGFIIWLLIKFLIYIK